MTTTRTGEHTLQELLDQPRIVRTIVARLFPELTSAQIDIATTDFEVTEQLEAIREAVRYDSEVANSVVAEDDNALYSIVLRTFRACLHGDRGGGDEFWEADGGYHGFVTVLVNTFLSLLRDARNKLEKEYVAELMQPVREAHARWVEGHTSINGRRHLHIRPCEQDHSNTGLGGLGISVIDLGELLRRH